MIHSSSLHYISLQHLHLNNKKEQRNLYSFMESNTTSTFESRFTGCLNSPVWLPACRSSSGFQMLNHEGSQRNSKLRGLIRKLIQGRKRMYITPKPLDCCYDAASYAKNFDEGRNVVENPNKFVEDVVVWKDRSC